MLEGISNVSNCTFYFMEQFVWLCKAGLIKDKEWERKFAKASVYAEMMAYLTNITINSLKLAAILEREIALCNDLKRCKKEDGISPEGELSISTEIADLQARRTLRMVDILQDSLDSLITLNEIRGGLGRVAGHPTLLATAGLLSAAISARKTWPS